MLPSSPSADLSQCAFLRLCFGRAVFCCPFPGEQGSTTAHLRRLPRKGRARGAYKTLLKHRVQGAALPAMLPSSPSADYISDATLRLCFGRAVFVLVSLSRQNGLSPAHKKNTPAPLGRGCSAVIGNVRWKRKASFAAGSWPGSRSPGPMRHCGRRSARCAQRAARRIPGG